MSDHLAGLPRSYFSNHQTKAEKNGRSSENFQGSRRNHHTFNWHCRYSLAADEAGQMANSCDFHIYCRYPVYLFCDEVDKTERSNIQAVGDLNGRPSGEALRVEKGFIPTNSHGICFKYLNCEF